MEKNKQNIKENYKYPKDFQAPKLLEISCDEMRDIWKNVEDCFNLIGFNRWSISQLLNVRRQTYDRWLRIGTIPDAVIAINISILLDLPISVIFDPFKSCFVAFKNKSEIYINTLKKQLIEYAKNESVYIPKFWDKNCDSIDEKEEVLILPTELFKIDENFDNLFWTKINDTYSKTEGCYISRIVIAIKEQHYYKNDYYIIKKWNKIENQYEMEIAKIKFVANTDNVEICYNDNKKEKIALSSKNGILILGRIVKKIT